MTAGTNDFQALAIAVGANVLSQADYLALTALLADGFQPGLTQSAQLNKVLRQATFPGAALAQLICDTLGINIADDGNLAGFEANLKAMLQAIGRIKLTGNTAFYVSASGSDSNTGLTSGSPWATIQHAWNVLATSYDLNGFQATINVAGALTGGLLAVGPLLGQASPLIINTAAGSSINSAATAIAAANGANLSITGSGTLSSSGSYAISALGANVTYSGINFGAAATQSHVAALSDGLVTATGNYTISGSALDHLSAIQGGSMVLAPGITVTLTGTPAFASAFAATSACGIIFASGVTFSGSATGSRYSAALNGVITTNGGGANYFPGNSSGTTATGGVYA